MTNPGTISISDSKLTVHGRTLLTSVPSNIIISPAPEGNVNGVFVGAHADNSDCRHVFTLGLLEGIRFMCCFRFKIWWMTQRMGTCAKDIPAETQFLLIESRINNTADDYTINGDNSDSDVVYVVMLPLLEGAFRATLQGNDNNELQLCLESGDSEIKTDRAQCPLFMNSGSHPFDVISEAVRTVEAHMQSFRRRQEKKVPSILDYFGWCTWDAFYTDVTTEGIKEGLSSLAAGGTPAKFLIIDDGWQSVATDQQPHSSSVSNGSSFQSRLTHIKENYKFQKDGKDGQREEDPTLGLQFIVKEAKEQHSVKYVYVWHAVTGYWGGVKPGVPGMEHYESSVKYPIMSKGISEQEGDYALDIITSHGLGLVSPSKVFNFYNELHSYLAAAGIDGVKVDVQNILETLGAGFGGRVSLTRKFYQALEASITQNFPDNGIIACMSHNTDSIYSAKQTAVVRASDDFYPRDPASHTIHVASVAYNSIFLGEFMQPDWDMFHSLHPAAEYHAAARAIGGCAVYVSDKPGNHDFGLLRKLVLPDGTVLRAQLPGRPSRDCLFCDPTRDGKSLLKIWNINKFTGVVGAFNCQGAGWCRIEKKNLIHDAEPKDVTGRIHSLDVDYLARVAPDDWNGDVVLYSHKKGEPAYLKNGSSFSLTLKPKEYEVFTVVPVKVLKSGSVFAPIGLLGMFNSGGAIKSLEYLNDVIKMGVHGCGLFGVYCSVKPRNIELDSQALEYTYYADKGLITAMLPVPSEEGKHWNVNVEI